MVKTRRPMPSRVALALAAMLAGALPHTPALAASPDGGAASPTPGLLTPLVLPNAAAQALPDFVLNTQQAVAIAPGVTLSHNEILNRRGWVQAHVLTVDLTNPFTTPDLLFPGAVAAAQPLDEMAQQQGAVAAVNGDFFDMSGTKAPLSAAVAGGSLIKGPATGWPLVAGVGLDGLGRLAEMTVEGQLVLPDGSTYPISALNQHLPENAIGVFNSLWGPTSRYLTAKWGLGIKEVTVRDGVVVAVSDEAGEGQIPSDTVVLLGREAGAQALSKLKVGDRVTFQYSPKNTAGMPFWFALGGDEVLLQNGVVPAELDDKEAHPRTAIGFSADGRTMFLVAVDGRQASSRGMTKRELAELLKELGAASALNLDGGGSTTMVARQPGEAVATVANSPTERRRVPNGVGLFVKQGSGWLTTLNIVPQTDLPHADRLFPGLTGRFTVQGQDETMAPVAVPSANWWIAEGSGTMLAGGQVLAGQTGLLRLAVESQGIQASREIQVLGDLVRITAEPEVLQLNGAAGSFYVVGYDIDGYEAPVDSLNVQVDYDPSLLRVRANAAGGFDVTPAALEGSTTITLTVNGQRAVLPVSLGGRLTTLDNFEDLSGWTATAYPSVVGSSMAPAAGQTGMGLALTYDFTTTDATRAAYANAPAGMTLPYGTRSLGLWVKGDGNGAWLRAVVADAQGASYTLDLARSVTWTDWRFVEAQLPEGIAQPVTLRRIYPVETEAGAKYRGQLILDGLVARAPAAAPTVPEPEAQPDPMVVDPDQLTAGGTRFAVLSHSFLAATTAASPDAQALRATLQEIAAEAPDFLVLTGDSVWKPSWSSMTLLRQLIVGELGDLPVYYLPGTQEAGSEALVLQFFPRSSNMFDLDGTRFILLDSSAGSLRASDFDQLVKLQDTLEKAAEDPAVSSVVLLSHHPLQDPTGGDHELSDAREAALVQAMLSDFRTASGGKGAAYIAGAPTGGVTVERQEGVRNVTVGTNSWALFSLLPYGGADWLQVAEE